MLPATQALIREVAQRHHVKPDEILSRSKARYLFPARIEIAQALAARGYKPARIGRVMNRDCHTICYWLGRLSRPLLIEKYNECSPF